jgi:hypothetical protein
LDYNHYTWDKYLAEISEVDKTKAERYKKGRLTAFLTDTINYVMSCFPKSGEWFLRAVGQKLSSMPNRARNISCPSDEVLGCANHVNFIMLALLKKVKPSYSSYLNNDDLENKIDKEW